MISNDLEIGLNGHKYRLAQRLSEGLEQRLPAKVNIGSDSYDRENYLSNWIIKDLRGGIGIDEMDESVHSDRCWWTNCIIDYSGHITLPRLANAITGTGHGWASPESAAGDASTAFVWSDDNNSIDSDTSTAMTTNTCNVNNAYTEYEEFTITAANIDSIRYYTTVNVAKWDVMDIGVYYGAAWHSIYSGVPTANAWTTVAIGSTQSVTKARIRFQHNGTASDAATFSELDFGMATAPADYASETSYLFANFNSDLYIAAGAMLLKMDSSRNFFLIRTFEADITSIVPSLNSCLYIFIGDSDNYYYMNTNEYISQADAAGTYSIQWGDKLWKMTTAGVFTSSSDPNSATPTWGAEGAITDIASQVETLIVGPDADGNSVIYCATNSVLKVYDDTNTKWLDTHVRLPSHPNGGKGATYWNDAIYLSYGLGVKKYVPGSTGSISEVGLNRDGGIPYEYNGEIVKFCPDGDTDMFALIDASQVSGTGHSGLYAFNGRAWRCFWADSNDDAAMYDVIVSSAESEYAVYWGCGGSIYYIDLPRGVNNPLLMSTTTKYEYYSSGDDTTYTILGTTKYICQTFTPSSTHTVRLVRLKLAVNRYSTPNNSDVTVEIRATDGSGKPTGAALCSGTIDGSILTTDINGLWYDVSFGAGASLTGSTKYAIVIYCPSLSGAYLYVRGDSSSPSYAGGSEGYSIDSGSTWTLYTSIDLMFEEYSISASQNYAASGILLSPWFDGGTSAFNKLAKKLTTYAKSISSTETITIKYRYNRDNIDRDTGWNTLVALDTSAENGITATVFASGAGESFRSFQFRLDFARGATTNLTPELQGLVLSYKLLTGSSANKSWNFTVIMDGMIDNTSEKQQYENLWTALRADEDIPLIFRRDDTSETHYVQLFLQNDYVQTGLEYKGQMNLFAVEM